MALIVIAILVIVGALVFGVSKGLEKEPDIPAEIFFVISTLATIISWVGLYTHSLPENGIMVSMAIVAPIIAFSCFNFKNGSGIDWFDWSRPDPPPRTPEPVKPPLSTPTASVDTYGLGTWHTAQDLHDSWGGRNANRPLSKTRFKD